jgi:UDP-GlcNAc:undecaprenyl-phosphate GlcNAc-1-phosphate transferase
LGVATAGLLALWAAGAWSPPRNVILIHALLSAGFLSGFRGLLRLWRERSSGEEDAPASPSLRVGIIGAGTTGAKLALELTTNRKLGRSAVAFFDDDFQKWRKLIHEVPVIGMPECLLDGWAGKLDEVVIAMPDAPAERIREIDQLLRKTPLKCHKVSRPTGYWGGQEAA